MTTEREEALAKALMRMITTTVGICHRSTKDALEADIEIGRLTRTYVDGLLHDIHLRVKKVICEEFSIAIELKAAQEKAMEDAIASKKDVEIN